MMMQPACSWKRAAPEDLQALLAFLLPQEWRAVPFTARLLRDGRPALPSRLNSAVAVRTDGRPGAERIRGAILHTGGGLLLPVLPYAPGPAREQEEGSLETPRPASSLSRLLSDRVYSIMGPTREVRWLEGGIGREPAASIEYALMTVDARAYRRPQWGSSAPSSLRIRQAGVRDLNALFPLQKAYELEEVVVFPERFSEQACRLTLRHALRQQLVLVAELAGKAVAKAATNARGFQVDQIGGVFTHQGLRGSGIAALVVGRLLEEIFRTKRMVSLFVKRSNLPALALYRKLGFQSLDSYRISYYQR
ncbi:MAG: GNAT family N-acetyltransferase [Spirochaetales bacterium]|nr:GNAT family N-acetyltransferase [Spirochaetales bacterium]